jgi:alanyl-tRNA synthetase
MEFYGDLTGNRTPLTHKNIDTGMGFERLLMVLQVVDSVYDTDAFKPILEKIASLAHIRYGESAQVDISLRVIADHVRGLVFMAADGVLPGNEKRGYVFRRVLRRAVRHGHSIGIEQTFLRDVALVVINDMGVHYTELMEQRDHIFEVLQIEEEKFSHTLQTGSEILNTVIKDTKRNGESILSGESAFKLADTYGFPLEITQDIAHEHGLIVDTSGYAIALAEQQTRSRSARALTEDDNKEVCIHILQTHGETVFTGYSSVEEEPRIMSIIVDGHVTEEIQAPQPAILILDKTPFYAESGGQVGDQGSVQGPLGSFQIHDTKKPIKGLIAHYGILSEGTIHINQQVHARIDVHNREGVMRNHTATHLLHNTLRTLLGNQVQQRGSLVNGDRLRFDFTSSRPLSNEILIQLDREINQRIRENILVQTHIMLLEEAKSMGAMALFGEKYDQQVRVVTIGKSVELCGGTHCVSTGQIGTYITLQESSSAAGIRRIEAITGEAAIEYIRRQGETLRSIDTVVQAQPGTELVRIEKLREDMVAIRQRIKSLEQRLLGYQKEALLQQVYSVSSLQVLATTINVYNNGILLQELAAQLQRDSLIDIVLLAYTENKQCAFTVRLSDSAIRQGYNAAALATHLGKLLDGKGGGKVDVAQGGGKNIGQLSSVLATFDTLLMEYVPRP